MRRIVPLILALSLVLAACGDSKSGTSATTTTKPTTTTTIPPAAADKTKAEAVVLTQADVGSEFEPAKKDEDDDESTPEADEAFKTCSQNNPFLNSEEESRSAESEFDKDEFTSVGSDVEFWTSEAELKAAFDIISTDAFVECLNGAFVKLFGDTGGAEGVTINNVKSVKKTVTAPGTAQSTGIQTSLDIAGGPIKVKLFLDMIFMRQGRAAAFVMASSVQAPYPPAEQERLSTIVAQRLVANAG